MRPTHVAVESWLRLPGMLCTADVFEPLGSAWSRGRCVVDVPLAGTTLDEARLALLDAANANPGPIGVIGLSLGAIVAMAAAGRHPDAFAALVLMSTNARAPSDEQHASWSALDGRVAAGEFDQIAAELSPPLWAAGAGQESLAHGRDMALEVGADAFRDQLAVQQSRYDLRPGLTTISAPTLVVAGSADQLCPIERHREIAQLVSGASLVEIEGAGHLVTVERPEQVTRLITRWWAEGPVHDHTPDAAAS